MIVLNFEVVKQTVSQKNFEKLVNDSSNYVKLCFDFKDPDWSDVCKRILFHSRSSETYCKELDENHEVIVPWEVLTEDYFVFNLYGVDESLRITTTPKKVSLGNSGYSDEVEKPLPPTPSVLDDIYDRLDNADSSISVIGESVDALEVTVSTHTGSIAGLVNDVNGLGDSVDTLEDTVSRHTGSISDLTGTVNGHTRGINSLTGSVSALSNGLDALGDDVDSLETVVNGHANNINSLTGDVNRIDGTVTDLTGTVNDHSNMLSNHDRSINNLENALDNVSDTVDSLESTVSEHTNSIDGLDSMVNDLRRVFDKHDWDINDIGEHIRVVETKLNNTVEMTVEYTDGTTATFEVVVK